MDTNKHELEIEPRDSRSGQTHRLSDFRVARVLRRHHSDLLATIGG